VKLLLDINVVLDVVLAREPWGREASRLFAIMEDGGADGYLAGHTITTVYYITARAVGAQKATAILVDLLRTMHVVPVEKSDFIEAATLGFRDFEDAVQAVCALKIGADAIVTRDVGDFAASPIPALPAGSILARL
jgi:predicted nucleic acid-binding protein